MTPADIVTRVEPFVHAEVRHAAGLLGRHRTTTGIVAGHRWSTVRIATDRPGPPVEIPVGRIRSLATDTPATADELSGLAERGIHLPRERDRTAKLRGLSLFHPDALWAECREKAATALTRFRGLPRAWHAQHTALRERGEATLATLQACTGATEIGFHYNAHGGLAEDYLLHGGIRAQRGGDSALRYGGTGHLASSVYYFSSAYHALCDILGATHGDNLFPRFRMGKLLCCFDFGHPLLQEALDAGAVRRYSEICLDCDTNWLAAHRLYPDAGVPNEAFLLPPLPVFHGTARRLGLGRLNWDEETLVTMIYLETAVTSWHTHRHAIP